MSLQKFSAGERFSPLAHPASSDFSATAVGQVPQAGQVLHIHASPLTRPAPLTPELFLANADHTLLSPDATFGQVQEFLAGAIELGVARVCLSSVWVAGAARWLRERGSGIEICTVTGFPHGTVSGRVQALEAADAVHCGAREVDMVLQRGLVHAAAAGDAEWSEVREQIACVRESIGEAVLKVILETAALSEQEIVGACAAAVDAGADFVKTSTGFSPAGGASLAAVRLMRECVGSRAGVKASGGIRSWREAELMWEAGASRFGVSATAQIAAEARAAGV